MNECVFRDLTADEAEQTIAGIWLSIERFGFPSANLSFVFQTDGDRLDLGVEFEDESVAMVVVRSLSTGLPVEDVGLLQPPAMDEDSLIVSHDAMQ